MEYGPNETEDKTETQPGALPGGPLAGKQKNGKNKWVTCILITETAVPKCRKNMEKIFGA